ncbi:hypothetical protein QJS10_CPB20g00724 [Acorus calamus]|uniref:Nuclear factor related to kappa-B-binding protein second winged helix domain-containing protein n=1 Tax=Acorus calamus TaxID=4465 RepID=A0AAV9C8I1_ACOCL|nr:hypothetical protein QJS10_CPB20g00724 [Acorus calamus]
MNFNKSQRIYTPKTPDLYLGSDRKSKLVQEKFIRNSTQDGMSDTQNFSRFARGEETESDSSEHADEEVDASPLMRKSGYQKPYSVKAVYDQKKFLKQVKKEKEVVDANGRFRFPESESFSAKGKFKGKSSNQAGYLHDLHKVSSKLMKNNGSQMPFLRGYSAEKNFKWKPDLDYPVSKSNYVHDYASGVLDGEEDLLMNSRSMDKSGSGSQFKEAVAIKAEHHERTDVPLVVCNSRTKKRKGKVDDAYIDDTTEPDYVESSSKKQNNEPKLMKKGGKKKVEPGSSPLPLVNTDPLVPERGSADLETETKPLKKSFIPITPTVHTGFSFSIIHLLTSIRKAMITVQAEDVAEASGLPDKNNGNERHQTINGVLPPDKLDPNSSEQTANKNLPSLSVQQIVTRVRSNPGDPSILDMQEPLHDLVRGVLKIFSSKTAPLGAKGWKPLVVYEKSTKSWSWIGPFSSRSDHDLSEEETSSDAWGIPHKMLVKLVDVFANWLKSGQETLRQIGTLPAPPVCLQPCLSEKERFRDLRAQKSLNTISPSSDEMRAYFRREEVLRYSIPDRAFPYTAADGKKSIVAPLRRCGGKPTSKARDHFMLKPDRPPHVTILCLVRDAAARLPGNIGTRADVCTLIRDSQYIVEDVTDAQVNQVVSGALDRLHYEIDPCVQYDSDRKLWVYLHRDREEEDFDDDGTSSTKKWKRQRKDPTETSEVGKINDNGPGDQPVGESATGYEFNPDLNVEASTIYGGETAEPSYNDAKPNIEEPYISSGQGNAHQEHPMGWGVLDLNSFRETKMLCQENSTNEDFDDETYGREQAVGVMTAGL